MGSCFHTAVRRLVSHSGWVIGFTQQLVGFTQRLGGWFHTHRHSSMQPAAAGPTSGAAKHRQLVFLGF